VALKSAVEKAASVGIDTSRSTVVLDATRLTERVQFRAERHKQLKAALQTAEAATKKEDGLQILTLAVCEAERVGINSGNDFENVVKALKALGKKGELALSIGNAMGQGETSTLETLLARAAKEGFSPEALASASSFVNTLQEEDRVSKDLVEAMGSGDIAALAEALDMAKQMEDFSKRHHYTHEKAKAVLNAVRLATAAVKSRDLMLVQMAIDAGVAAGAQSVGPIAEIDAIKSQLLLEREFCDKLVQCGTDVTKLRQAMNDMPAGMPVMVRSVAFPMLTLHDAKKIILTRQTHTLIFKQNTPGI